MGARSAAILAIACALTLSACAGEPTLADRAEYARGLQDGADTMAVLEDMRHHHDARPKDQHRLVTVCINARHKEDVADIQADLGSKPEDMPRCDNKLIESDYVIEVQRQSKPDGNVRVIAVIVDRRSSKEKRFSIISPGYLRPDETKDCAAHRLLTTASFIKALKQGPTRKPKK